MFRPIVRGRLDPSTERWRVRRPLGRQISDDHYRARDRDDPPPNCAPFPSDGLSRSTTGGFRSNNGRVQHLNPGAAVRPRGYARHASGSLCPVSLPPFRLRVDTSPCGRHQSEPAVLPQKTKALPPLPPLLSFQIVDSRFSPLCYARGYGCRLAASIEATIS
jgi:hypothetical protein